jgi:Cu2+-exporting ATPase
VLGTVVYVWGGKPFLVGGVAEVRDRQPGMMLLTALAISVAYGSSLASSLGWGDLDFWWELAALIVIMLSGHWQEMKAIGQARGALAALPVGAMTRLQQDRPDAVGLALPGMPADSPGMGGDINTWERQPVVLVGRDAALTPFDY